MRRSYKLAYLLLPDMGLGRFRTQRLSEQTGILFLIYCCEKVWKTLTMSILMYVFLAAFLAIFRCTAFSGLCSEWPWGCPQKPQRGCASTPVCKLNLCFPLYSASGCVFQHTLMSNDVGGEMHEQFCWNCRNCILFNRNAAYTYEVIFPPSVFWLARHNQSSPPCGRAYWYSMDGQG